MLATLVKMRDILSRDYILRVTKPCKNIGADVSRKKKFSLKISYVGCVVVVLSGRIVLSVRSRKLSTKVTVNLLSQAPLRKARYSVGPGVVFYGTFSLFVIH
jgi:hypothetical protein